MFLPEKALFYRQGYIRTSSDNYSLSTLTNWVHLTNNCLQKHGDNYGKHESGNTISFHDFSRFLAEKIEKIDKKCEKMEIIPENQEKNCEKIEKIANFDKIIVSRIKDLIIDVYSASKDNINPNKRGKSFELLGFDFLVDEDLRTWLLEVNTNPYLGVANEYIEGLLGRMIDDLLEITVDAEFKPDEAFLASKFLIFLRKMLIFAHFIRTKRSPE